MLPIRIRQIDQGIRRGVMGSSTELCPCRTLSTANFSISPKVWVDRSRAFRIAVLPLPRKGAGLGDHTASVAGARAQWHRVYCDRLGRNCTVKRPAWGYDVMAVRDPFCRHALAGFHGRPISEAVFYSRSSNPNHMSKSFAGFQPSKPAGLALAPVGSSPSPLM
jgi:hypothetical protein